MINFVIFNRQSVLYITHLITKLFESQNNFQNIFFLSQIGNQCYRETVKVFSIFVGLFELTEMSSSLKF